tara:strand:- start:126 stop:569 length:444 start_codon:yes stop_codon:yes gene_type:complete
MAHGIEARVPFLDNEITDLMQKIPAEYRTSKKDFKYLLRESVKKILPLENLFNKKRGFIGLESQKQNYNFENLINNLFNENKIKKQGILNEKFIYEFLNSFKSKDCFIEKKTFGLFNKIYSYKSLWALIMYQLWYDIFIEKDNSFKL